MSGRNGRLNFSLDQDDEGETSNDFGQAAPAQDDAFVAAMRKAIQRGKEKVEEGVKKPDAADNRYVRPVRGATHVRTASSSYYD